MKKIFALLLTLCMVIGLFPTAAFAADAPTTNGNWSEVADTDWYNTTDTEFTIDTAAELAGLASLVNGGNNFSGKTIKLGADINLAGKEWTPIGGYDGAKYFYGVFDGNDYTISNLTITNVSTDVQRLGLFANIQSNNGRVLTSGYAHSFTLKNTYIGTTGTNVRAGAATSVLGTNGTIREVVIDGFTYVNTAVCSENIAYIGGLAGYVDSINTYEEGREIEDNIVKNVNITANGVLCIGGVFGYVSGWAEFWNTDAENISINATSSVAHPQGDYAVMVGGFFGLDAYYNGFDYKNCDVKNVDITLNGTSKFVAGGFGGQALGGSVWTTDKNIDTCSAQGKITNNGTSVDTRLGGYYGVTGYGGRVFDGTSANVNIVSLAGISGGFVGNLVAPANNNAAQSFKNCSASGSISGNIAGGFIGYINSTTNINIYKTCTQFSNVTGSKVENAIANSPKEYYIDNISEDSEKYNFVSATAWATVNGVDVGFATIQEAVNTGATAVTLLQDATEDFTVNNDLTLNLGAFKLVSNINLDEATELTVSGTNSESNIVLPELEEKTGYTSGWFTDGAEAVAVEGGYKITPAEAEKTYSAYKANTYTIKFDANGGTGTMDSLTATYDSHIDLTANSYNNTGKYFIGWALKASDTVAEFTDETSVMNLAPSGEVTLYAVWNTLPPFEPETNMTAQEYTYSGQPHGFSMNPEDTDYYSVAFKLNGNDFDGLPQNVGVYDVIITRETDGTHCAYHNEIIGGLVIKPATLTATYAGETVKFGDAPALTVKVEGFVNGETADTADGYTAPTVDNSNTAIGRYELTPAGGEATNYIFNYVSGTLTIEDYEVIQGENQQVIIGSDAVFTSNADFSKFAGVKVDGELISEEYYTAESGSTKITLKASYVETLSAGEHTLTIVSTDGEATTGFTVANKSAPKPETKPEPCDHSFDANGKCKYCGIIVIDHTTEKADDESNPNTGAESAIGVAAAIAAISLAGIAVSKKII